MTTIRLTKRQHSLLYMAKELEYDERVMFRLSGKDRLKLATWAEAMGMSTGEVLRELVWKWFEHKVSLAKPSRDDKNLK